MMKPDPVRRLLLGALTALPVVGLPRLGAQAAPIPLPPVTDLLTPIRFDVLRGSDSIGTHSVGFRRDGDDLIVDIDIALEVRFAFVTVYRYRHTNRETWRDGRLTGIDARTDDDGDRFFVRAVSADGGLRIESNDGTSMAPAETLSTSYWNARTVRQSRLIDTQYGRLAAVTSTPAGARSVMTAAGPVQAECWRVSGDLDLEVCYDAQGAWVGLDFEARGSRITYAHPAVSRTAG